MRFARVATALTLALLVGCSGDGEQAGRFDAPAPTPAGTSKQTPARTVAPGRLRPPSPARLFAGTASTLGELTRYCKNTTCEESAAGTPTFVPVPAGTFVLFTLAETPLDARVEVRERPSERPSTSKLSPSTLMVFNHGLVAGRYLVDLHVKWRASEARWRFGLNVRK